MLTQDDWDKISALAEGKTIYFQKAEYPKIVLLAERAVNMDHLFTRPCHGVCFAFNNQVSLVFGE